MSAIHPRTAYFLLVRSALKFTDEVRKHVESIHSARLFFVVHVQINLYIVHTYIYWPLRLSSGIKFQCVQKYHKNIVKQQKLWKAALACGLTWNRSLQVVQLELYP